MELIAYVGKDKENWGQITALANRGEWDKIILIKDKSLSEVPSKGEVIEVDANRPMLDLKTDLMEKLKKKVSGEFEVALSLASGNGKEHMAVISALLNLPVGIKLVVYTKEGIQYVT
ncbi:hypothetical protein FJZ18_00845 [Candidatus Pacearchaeota archaeon]|nr:hypothetical protein [Candidatus Pacearchaeota archaeon]